MFKYLGGVRRNCSTRFREEGSIPGQGIIKALILLRQSAVKIKGRKVPPPSAPLVSLATALASRALSARIRAKLAYARLEWRDFMIALSM